MSKAHLSDTEFSSFALPDTIEAGIRDAGFEFCTPIQALALPVALAGKDVTGQAQTGTGKTAAFLIATLNQLLARPKQGPDNALRALILAPTRELAIQIHEDAKVLAAHTPFRLALAYGGIDYQKQRQHLEAGADILIGTPGRIIDYFKQGVFKLNRIEVMVLDEADRMFDLGFIRDIRYLLRAMPAPDQRLNMLFSATLSLRVNELAYEHMNNAQAVKVETESITSDRVQETVYMPANEDKIPLLMGLLKRSAGSRSLVFVNTKHIAERIQDWLRANDFHSGLLSGDVRQQKREKLLQGFKDGDIDTLVATDVAARGLHIPDVSQVINFDLPQDAEDYVHRIGRTARAGASGLAISLACETYAINLVDIEEFIGHSLEVVHDYQDVLYRDPETPRPRKRRGKDPKRDAKGGAKREPKAKRERKRKPDPPAGAGRPPQVAETKPKEPPAESKAPSQAEPDAPESSAAPTRRRPGQRETPAVG